MNLKTRQRNSVIDTDPDCPDCGEQFPAGRLALGIKCCLVCGETKAKLVKHCVVPMPKSNYIVVTDPKLLVGLNNSHKGVS